MPIIYLRRTILLLALFIIAAFIAPVSFASAQETRIGVVLLHGKTGQPRAVGAGVVEPLKKAGFLVEAPEMPWSRDRYIDRTYDEALNEIDLAVARLTAQGATKVVIAGHSMGADAALAYAARHGDIAGIILLAPGHIPDFPAFQQSFAVDVAKARSLIEAGQGDQKTTFRDTNLGKEFTRIMKPTIYFSFFSPDGVGAAAKSAKMISPDIPVLYVVGSGDPLTRAMGKDFIFYKLPENPLTKYVVVDADHLRTPVAATAEMIGWLRILAVQ